jgi:hypothetical protein
VAVKEVLTLQEWLDKGKKLFGEDMFQWEFVCPSCGNVQKPEDFRKHESMGATPDTARYNCIGRYDGHMDNDAFVSGGKQPCNYCSGGLININPVVVKTPEGKEIRSFAFNDPDHR